MARDWGLGKGGDEGGEEVHLLTITAETRLMHGRIQATSLRRAPACVDHEAMKHLDDMATLLIRMSDRIDAQEVEAKKHRKKIAFLCSVIKYNIELHKLGYIAAACKKIETAILIEWEKE